MAFSTTLTFVSLLMATTGALKLDTAANPIRKVVTLMQNMQKEIEGEGAKEKELFDKFMCYCSGNNGELTTQADKAKASIEELTAKVASESAESSQSQTELAQHKADREGATSDLEAAAVLRAKEEAEFEATSADLKANIAGMASAIPALEKGMGGASFVQLPQASLIKKLVSSSPTLDTMDRNNVMAFLEQSGDYVPQSGQIVGILKSMKDDMEKSLADAETAESVAVAGYGDLKASKEQAVELATEAIETKTARVGELAVSVAESTDALEDSKKEFADVTKFIATLAAECGTKEKEFAARSKVRAEEISAISDAIGILNDDDALDVFKKAIPSALIQGSTLDLIQKGGKKANLINRVQAILSSSQSRAHSPQIGLLLFNLRSKVRLGNRQGSLQFEEITKMIDAMITLLGKQQAEDAKQKTWCEDEFVKSDDESKAATSKKSSLEAAISEQNDELAELMEAINGLTAEVTALDKSVADATVQRKAEHAAFVESAQLTEVAIGLIGKAKQRLQKFYNPVLFKAAPKTERTMEQKIIDAGTFAQVNSHFVSKDLTFGKYQKSEKASGVMGLMDMITKELAADAKDAGFEEKTAQTDYAELMSAAQASRASDTKSIVDKNAAKATVEEKLMSTKKSRTLTTEELDMISSYIGDLHVSCDFIMQNFDLRKEARTAEIESLKNAKAVLAGASFGR